MNKKLSILIIVLVVAALCVLAVIYAPRLTEILQNLHSGPLPQH